MLYFTIVAYDLLSQAEMTFERIANYCRPFRIFAKLFLSMILRFYADLGPLCWIDLDILLIMNLYPFLGFKNWHDTQTTTDARDI